MQPSPSAETSGPSVPRRRCSKVVDCGTGESSWRLARASDLSVARARRNVRAAAQLALGVRAAQVERAALADRRIVLLEPRAGRIAAEVAQLLEEAPLGMRRDEAVYSSSCLPPSIRCIRTRLYSSSESLPSSISRTTKSIARSSRR